MAYIRLCMDRELEGVGTYLHLPTQNWCLSADPYFISWTKKNPCTLGGAFPSQVTTSDTTWYTISSATLEISMELRQKTATNTKE
jgi:hypothetical protein